MKRQPRKTKNDRRNERIAQEVENELLGTLSKPLPPPWVHRKFDAKTVSGMKAAFDQAYKNAYAQFFDQAVGIPFKESYFDNEELHRIAMSFPIPTTVLTPESPAFPSLLKHLGPQAPVDLVMLDAHDARVEVAEQDMELRVIKPRLRGVRASGITLDDMLNYCEKDLELSTKLRALTASYDASDAAEGAHLQQADPA